MYIKTCFRPLSPPNEANSDLKVTDTRQNTAILLRPKRARTGWMRARFYECLAEGQASYLAKSVWLMSPVSMKVSWRAKAALRLWGRCPPPFWASFR